MKRSKNIFNSPIVSESLNEEDGNKEFKVGNLIVASNWLINIDQEWYIRYILSSIHLSQLEKELEDLKDNTQHANSTTKQSNLFKIGNIKKKIDKFSLVQIEKKEPLAKQSQLDNEPPDCQGMVIQKIGGFFTSSIERKCYINDKILMIQSKKDQKVKEIGIDIRVYTMEMEAKEKPIENKQFEAYQWLPNFDHRILLYGQDLKKYCLYGKFEDLKQFQRYFQVENLEVKKLSVFEKLNNQFEQKIITLFGNKVRFYEHNIRTRRAEKDALSVVKQFIEDYSSNLKSQQKEEQKLGTKQKAAANHKINAMSSQMTNSIHSESKQSNSLGQSGLHQSNSPLNSSIIEQSQKDKTKPIQKSGQVFKLKCKSTVVFYDELDKAITFDEQNAPYTVGDLKLNLKEEIGMSDVDEESDSMSNRSISRNLKKKVVHMTLKNALDENQKFNINIHEVTSMGESLKFQSSSSISSIQNKQSSDKSLGSDFHLNFQKKKIDNDFILHEKALPNMETRTDYDRTENDFLKEKENFVPAVTRFLIKNIEKRKIGQMKVVQALMAESVYMAVQRITLYYPYHTDKIKYSIFQLHPNLQMENTIVCCAKVQDVMEEAEASKEMQYRHYKPVSKEKHFQITNESNYFVFALEQETKVHYIPFEVETNPKYQVNCSQLMIADLDERYYKFAAKLSLYKSPEAIVIPTKMSTIQFLHKYISLDRGDYEFKHSFINEKKVNYLIEKAWQQKIAVQVINLEDEAQFAKIVFKSLPSSIVTKMKEKVKHLYNAKSLFQFTENQLKLIEDNIASLTIWDIRVFMKSSSLILKVIKSNPNVQFQQRLEQVYIYFLYRYGSTKNLAMMFIKEVLSKLDQIILMAKRQEEVNSIIDLYFEVEYEIDELFMEISKYFKR